MANHNFSFQKAPRSIMNLEMADGTLLLVRVPAKRTVEKLMKMGDLDNRQFLGEFDAVIAEILSNNQQGKKYTSKWVHDNMEFEDQLILLEAVMKFIGAIGADPN